MTAIRDRIIESGRNEWAKGPQNIEERMTISAAFEALRIAKERIHYYGYRPPIFEVTAKERQAFLQAIDWTTHTIDSILADLETGSPDTAPSLPSERT